MTIDRRNFVAFGALLSSGVLSGCADGPKLFTSTLFENHRYVENVSSVLISQDEKNIVVLTEKYHYIFDAPPDLVAALKAPFHNAITADLGTLHVKGSGAAVIRYRLELGENASPQERDQARAAGFKASAKRAHEFSIGGELRGTRYSANGVQPPAQSPLLLNRTYSVSVNAELSPVEKSGRALLTPITVTADGAMVLGAVAVGVLLLPFVLVLVSNAGGIGIGP